MQRVLGGLVLVACVGWVLVCVPLGALAVAGRTAWVRARTRTRHRGGWGQWRPGRAARLVAAEGRPACGCCGNPPAACAVLTMVAEGCPHG